MKILFLAIIGTTGFVMSYYLNASRSVKYVTITEVSRELKSNQAHLREIERFNQNRRSPRSAEAESVIFKHLTETDVTPEQRAGQFDEISEFAKRDSQKAIQDYKKVLSSLMEKDDVIEYGIAMVQMSQIPELQGQAAELALNDLNNLTLKEAKLEDAKSEQEENKILSDDKYVHSLNMIYLAYLNTQVATDKNPLNETIDIIVRNEHSAVRSSIASNFLKAYPASRDDLMNGLQAENIHFPGGNHE